MPQKNLILNFISRGDQSVSRTINGIKGQAIALGKESVSVNIGANDDDWLKKSAEVLAQSQELGKTKTVLKIAVDANQAEEKMKLLRAEADALGLKKVNIDVRVNGDKALLSLTSLKATTALAGGKTSDKSGGAGGGGLASLVATPGGASGLFTNPVGVAAILASLPFLAQAASGGMVLALGGAFAAIAAIGASKNKTVQASFATLKTKASQSLIDIGKPFVPVMNSIISTATSTMQKLTPIFAGAVGSFAGPFKQFSDSFISAFGQPSVKSAIQAVATAFGGIVKSLTPQVAGDVGDIANGIKNIADAVAEHPQAIADFISDMFKIAGGALDIISSLTRVANWIETHWDVVKWIVVPVIAAVQLVIAHWNELSHETAVIFDGIRHEIMHVMDLIYNDTIGVAIRIGHNVETQFNSLKNSVINIYNGLRSSLANIWNSIWSNTIGAVSRGIGSVVSWFRGMPGRIVGAIGNMRNLLTSAGRDVIQGLWDGLTFVWKKVTGWISGLASWIKQHKGPVSLDRTLLEPAGRALMEGLSVGLGKGFVKVKDIVTGAAGNIGSWIGGAASSVGNFFSSLFGGGGGSGVQRWKGLVDLALAMNGLPRSLEGRVLYQMQTESGGNPNAINRTDSNALAGDPSRGLLQTIMSTFTAFHMPGTSGNIYDPLANIAAAINYAKHVYGPSLMSGGMGMGSGHGYAYGTSSASAGWAWVGEQGPELMRFRGGEQVLSARQSATTSEVHYHLEFSGMPLMSKAEIGIAINEAQAYARRHGNK